jgi:GGDEF domain-containing protein
VEVGHVYGDLDRLVYGVRIPLGQGVSGWVAANRRTIVNSDPALDFGDIAPEAMRHLKSCLSAPIVSTTSTLGVITLYSRTVDAFDDADRACVELFAGQLAKISNDSDEFRAALSPDQPVGLSGSRKLRQLFHSTQHATIAASSEFALLLIYVSAFASHGSLDAGWDQFSSIVDACSRHYLRDGDIVFDNENSEFIVLIQRTGVRTASSLGEQIQSSIAHSIELSNRVSALVHVTCASSPEDGGTFHELLTAARSRLEATCGAHAQRSSRRPQLSF